MVGEYLQRVFELCRSGDASERTYYPVLAGLLEKAGAAKVKIEARHSKVGIPDLKVENDKGELIGYIEAKDAGRGLDHLNKGEIEQLDSYKKEYPNLIVTNFIEFRFYDNGREVDKIQVGQPDAWNLGVLAIENEGRLEANLERFLHTTVPQSRSGGQLAKLLADKGKILKKLIAEEINLEDGTDTPTEELLKAFQKTLNPAMTPDEFADMYAQAIVFGLFTARLNFTGEGFDTDKAWRAIPHSIPLLRKVFQVINGTDSPQYIRWLIDDMAEVLDKTDMDRIKEEFAGAGKGKDPLFHFYEPFLAEYDSKKREQLGVYYTPLPVVQFITKSVQEILINNFGKTEGFADSSVTLLDPAAGTMTFSAQAVALAHEKFTEKNGSGGWPERVEKHILRDFYAFELLMGPYTVGHLKIALMLKSLGYEMKDEDRFGLYLTNTLDMEKFELQQSALARELTEESEKAFEVKGKQKILAILGNPPYSGISVNIGEWISEQIETYKFVDGKSLGERKYWLQDDYVKFFRFAQWKIEQNGMGILAYITNHAWLDNPTFRGMRASILNTFDKLYILNLHGSHLKKEKTPEGGRDENVFSIQPGVAITIAVKGGKNTEKKVYYADLWGLRKDKYDFLEKNIFESVDWTELKPKSDMYWLVPKDETNIKEYMNFVSVKEIFPVNSTGIVTARDDFVLDDSKDQLRAKILGFIDPDKSTEETKEYLRAILGRKEITDVENYAWKTEVAKKEMQKLPDLEKYFQRILYRPFDEKWIFYHPAIVWRTREEVMRNMINQNIALICNRNIKSESVSHYWITDLLSDFHVLETANANPNVFPLYVFDTGGQGSLLEEKRSNIDFSKLPKEYVGRKPEEIFDYIYAVLYSPTYRQKYAEFLKTDFSRVPFTTDMELFGKLAMLGERLVKLHLLRAEDLHLEKHKYEGLGENLVEEVKHEDNKIYINKIQYFDNVGEVWNYQIGGYQVLYKWLKDRKGRKLTEEERIIYRKIICSLEETREKQGEIDKIYNKVEANL